MRNATITTPNPRAVKLKRAAERLGFPYSSLRDAGIRGEFPLIRLGKALYAENRDLDRWYEARKRA